MELFRSTILVCGGTGCTSSGSMKLYERFEQLLAENGLDKEIKLVRTGCFGLCAAGPVVIVYPEGAFYSHVKLEDVDEIVSEHLVKGRVVQRLLYKDSADEETRKIKPLDEINFYGKQKRVALRNCGVIDPENIDEYIAFNGYKALAKVLTEMSREDVVDTVLKSGLRGRGGGGFPTGLKWKFAMPSTGKKYVCCNADEGDPGAFMDRSMMECVPFQVMEGMLIGAYATGATKIFIYCRAEYPLAVNRLKTAIARAEEIGLLGEHILGSDFNFRIHVAKGAGAFVCGEGSALTASIEGNRGMPRVKPPRTIEHGLWGKPTVLNNVETFANVPLIIKNGVEWYHSIGTEKSPGTKAFALTGNVVNTGLIEVPMGTTIREVVFDIGGGIPDGKKFKAVQIGGPSGGATTASDARLRLAQEHRRHDRLGRPRRHG